MTPVHFNGQHILGWKVWTDDGSVYDSDNHTWSEVPDIGIEVLFTYHWTKHEPPRPTRMSWTGWDVYEIPGDPGGPKLGRTMDDYEYEELRLSAHEDQWRPANG